MPIYAFAPIAVTSIFVAKLLSDLIETCKISLLAPIIDQKAETRNVTILRMSLILTIISMLGFSITYEVNDNVLNNDTGPQQVGAFLKQNVPTTAIVETWEREIGILTNHTYHYPDQILLKDTQGKIFRNIQDNYALGSDYFQKIKPSYLVIGWYARHTGLYDTSYLINHACLVSTFGDNAEWQYEVYRIELQPKGPPSTDHIPACSLRGS